MRERELRKEVGRLSNIWQILYPDRMDTFDIKAGFFMNVRRCWYFHSQWYGYELLDAVVLKCFGWLASLEVEVKVDRQGRMSN